MDGSEQRPGLAKASRPDARLFGNLALLATSLLLMFAACEAAVRIHGVRQWYIPRDSQQVGGIFTFRFKPDIELLMDVSDVGKVRVVTNSDGFRGPTLKEISGKPLRIVSIGDSLMFGWGLEIEQHAMALVTDAYMRSHPDREIGHAWIAAPTWGPPDYYYAYATLVQPYQPDLIVVGFFAGNDVLPAQTWPILDPARAPRNDSLEAEERPWLLSYEWAMTRLRSSLLIAKLALKVGYVPRTFMRYDKDMEGQRLLWGPTFTYLRALAEQVKAHRAELAVVSWPSLAEVSMPEALAGAGFDPAMPDKVLADFCARQGIELISLLGAFQEANADDDLFWKLDRHPTAKGQQVAAAQIARRLDPIIDRVWEAKQRAVEEPR
jgi:hypothetical protein